MLTDAERERFLLALRDNTAFREEVRQQVLTAELLSLPDAFARLVGLVDQIGGDLRTLTERVDTLTERVDTLSREVRTGFGKLGERLGEVAEDGADAVLEAVFLDKSYRLIGEPQLVDLGDDEVDVALAYDDGSGQQKTAVVEVKFRLRSVHVGELLRKIRSEAWQQSMAQAGFGPPWVPYLYGSRVYADALRRAGDDGVGVLAPTGEKLRPSLLAGA